MARGPTSGQPNIVDVRALVGRIHHSLGSTKHDPSIGVGINDAFKRSRMSSRYMRIEDIDATNVYEALKYARNLIRVANIEKRELVIQEAPMDIPEPEPIPEPKKKPEKKPEAKITPKKKIGSKSAPKKKKGSKTTPKKEVVEDDDEEYDVGKINRSQKKKGKGMYGSGLSTSLRGNRFKTYS